ncbi:hypothetical protein DXG01_006087 [Tephrocybe rancida]|nr:hypothetical protein DXG01_006087 [Tephrocybe rancida]
MSISALSSSDHPFNGANTICPGFVPQKPPCVASIWPATRIAARWLEEFAQNKSRITKQPLSTLSQYASRKASWDREGACYGPSDYELWDMFFVAKDAPPYKTSLGMPTALRNAEMITICQVVLGLLPAAYAVSSLSLTATASSALPSSSLFPFSSGSSSGQETSSRVVSSVQSSILLGTSITSPALSSALPSSTPVSGAPVQSPIPGIFPATDPKHPPSTQDSDDVVPDFGPAWAAAYSKAKDKIAGFTLDELASVATGVESTGFLGRCVGNIPTVEPASGRGWPGLCLEDSPLGVRLADFVTAFPTGINTAATFNRSLIRLRGLYMGLEHVGKGVNVALGPMMNLARVAEGGRNFEGFGEDPFLAGEAAYETILGMQQGGVQACAKHFIDNEQEHDRMTSSSNVDDRTQHEIYAQPFIRSVMAGAASIMCSYNQINGTYACENNKTLNDVLKRELGFQGCE